MLSDLFRQTMTTRRGDKPVQIVSEPKTNSLVIYANPQELAQIQELVTLVDVEPDMARFQVFKTFKLTYGESWGVVNMINQIFRGAAATRGTRSWHRPTGARTRSSWPRRRRT